MQKEVKILITVDKPLEDTWEQLRMREPERFSFHSAREAAIMVAEELEELRRSINIHKV